MSPLSSSLRRYSCHAHEGLVSRAEAAPSLVRSAAKQRLNAAQEGRQDPRSPSEVVLYVLRVGVHRTRTPPCQTRDKSTADVIPHPASYP